MKIEVFIVALCMLVGGTGTQAGEIQGGAGQWGALNTVSIGYGPAVFESSLEPQQTSSATREIVHAAYLEFTTWEEGPLSLIAQAGIAYHAGYWDGYNDRDFGGLLGIGLRYERGPIYLKAMARASNTEIDLNRWDDPRKLTGFAWQGGLRWKW